MDFTFTEQQRMFSDAVAAFARKELAAGALARTHTSEFPRDVVLLGAGSTAVELRRSFCVRIAPVTVEQAEAMIDKVRDLAVLRGYRNLPRADCAALANAIRALSLLALLDARSVSEAEINPLIVKEEGQGVVAVDGLVVFADRPCNGVS